MDQRNVKDGSCASWPSLPLGPSSGSGDQLLMSRTQAPNYFVMTW